MEKIINQILDFPKMINEKIPRNNFNELMNNSEGSIASWTSLIYKIASLVILLSLLITILSGGIQYISEADGVGKFASILSMLVLVYVAFPIAQVVRSAGDALENSKSGIVEFLFKDFVTTNIKAIGHISALVALFTAINLTLSFIFDANLFNDLNTDFTDHVMGLYSLPIEAISELFRMVGLDTLGGLLQSFIDLNLSSIQNFGDGHSWLGLHDVASSFINVIIVLAQLYVTLAVYHFLYGLLSTLFNWIKSPSIPIKMS